MSRERGERKQGKEGTRGRTKRRSGL
uniref:Uncharacterized protein n=1 Tax=Anguilla anguilla TaxID=7936 RepID=A0A0E9SFG4_ANGAN